MSRSQLPTTGLRRSSALLQRLVIGLSARFSRSLHRHAAASPNRSLRLSAHPSHLVVHRASMASERLCVTPHRSTIDSVRSIDEHSTGANMARRSILDRHRISSVRQIQLRLADVQRALLRARFVDIEMLDVPSEHCSAIDRARRARRSARHSPSGDQRSRLASHAVSEHTDQELRYPHRNILHQVGDRQWKSSGH